MDIEPVDPRDIEWERHSAIYRVYFRGEGASTEFEVRNADAPEVLAWAEAQARASNRTYVVWVRSEDASGSPGLIRLAGQEDL